MPKPLDWDYYKTVTANHSFFWDSNLTEDRMWEISDWIGSLAPEQRKMLDDLLGDLRDDMESR